MNLYIANHLHHLERLVDDDDHPPEATGGGTRRLVRVPEPESTELIETLLRHATQDRYLVSVDWREPGDLVVWDNTAVMHRSAGGEFMGKYRRDMRRCTVHDGSSLAWGLNEKSEKRMGLP